MAARSRTPLHDAYGSVPTPNPSHLNKGYGAGGFDQADFAQGNPNMTSPLSQSLHQPQPNHYDDDFDHTYQDNSTVDGDEMGLQRTTSTSSTANPSNAPASAPSRSNTLKKRQSLSRKSSLKRSSSKRSVRAGSIKGVTIADDEHVQVHNSVFYTPVPTSGSPTEILANRFQAWRKFLKDLINYFREFQTSYEHRSKIALKVSNVVNNTSAPSVFLTEGGISEANRILRDFHKQAVQDANKAKDIENEVISQLSGLRSDLGAKIKEIKALSGDFKNTVDKEKEGTRKAVAALEDALAAVDHDHAATGKGDPFIIRLAVERQVERQIDEENYLHRAYLNLEHSGRELESIVIGEIQKAYNALATILKREADEAHQTVEKIRSGPIAMPKDHEWGEFVKHDPHFIDPSLALRRVEDIEYPGKFHPAAAEVRAGMLERKSKYLKSYTPGWYVLSPTHLHEFKSADRIYSQPPVMSLYLPEQKLGSHSQPGSSSNKFMLKGSQTGTMHRGHSWVFRAETYETMMAWYEDIKNLTEKTGEERNAFVRKHARSLSQGSTKAPSEGSDAGIEDEDEADAIPFSATTSVNKAPVKEQPQRPQPGGRFPSDLNANRHLQAPLSPSSGSSDYEHEMTQAAALPGSGVPFPNSGHNQQQPLDHYHGQQQPLDHYQSRGSTANPYLLPGVRDTDSTPVPQAVPQTHTAERSVPHTVYAQPAPQRTNVVPVLVQRSPQHYPQQNQQYPEPSPGPRFDGAEPYQAYQPITHNPELGAPDRSSPNSRHNSTYGDWMAPAAGSAALGAVSAEAYRLVDEDRTPRAEINQADSYMPDPQPAYTSTQAPYSHNDVEPVSGPSFTDSSIGHERPSSSMTQPTTMSALSESTQGETVPHDSGVDIKPVRRQYTDISVSDLHIPGEYPPTPATSGSD